MSNSGLTLFVCLFTCYLSCSAFKVEKAEPGHDVTLQCQGPRDADIEMLEWTKRELESDDYVFIFRDDHRYDEYQHPSFHGRVKLRDPTMTDGDASVILKNVTINDAGTYECSVGKRTSQQNKRSAPELFSSITLKVKHSDHKDITAKPGDSVILSCQHFSNIPITSVEWIRPELDQAGNVFLYRNGRHVPDNQHPYYKDLVELKDREMKDGDASLILKNVMTRDSGTYHCYVNEGGTKRKKRSINLNVPPPGHSEDGGDKGGEGQNGWNRQTGLAAGVASGLAVVLFLVGVRGFMVFQKLHPKNLPQKLPPE